MESYEQSYFTLEGDDMRKWMLFGHLKKIRNLSPKTFSEKWFINFKETAEEHFRKYHDEENEYIWLDILDSKGKLVGFFVLSIDNGNLIFEHMHIEPSFRPLGYGEATLNQFLNIQDPPFTCIYAFTFIKDHATNDFLDRYFMKQRNMVKEIIEQVPDWIDKNEQQLMCFIDKNIAM